MKKAKAFIYSLLQREQFGEGMQSLKSEKEIPEDSKNLQFSRFPDEDCLIWVKGRIDNSQLDLKTKHPMLLN